MNQVSADATVKHSERGPEAISRLVTWRPSGRNSGIQALRALAVLAVIVFHLNDSWLPGGFLGVDVFFVISGFVITQSLLRDWRPGLKDLLLRFYLRRFLRIAPALFVFLGLTAIAVALFIPRGFFLGGDAPATALAAVFGLGNISLYLADRGYFDERIEFNAFSHTWSLGVEEQFYLLYPLLLWWGIWLALRANGRRGQILALTVVALPSLASLLWSIIETASNPTAAFYLLTSRFWELGFGALLALVFAFGLAHPPRDGLRRLVLGVGSVLLAFALVFADKSAFPFPWALPAVLGTALLIAAYQAPETRSIGSGRGFRGLIITIGDWSYSLYLWHWAVIVLLRWTIGLEYWWHYVLAVVVTFVFGGLSYHLVEQPILRRRFHSTLSTQRLVASAVAVTVVVAGSLYVGDRGTERFLSLSTTAQGTIFNPPEGTPDPEEFYADYSGLGQDRTVFVVGDSHAGHFGTLLTELRAVMGFDYQVIDDRECRVAGLLGPRGDCEGHEDVVARIIGTSNPGDVVLLSSLRTPRISNLVDGQTQSISAVIADFQDEQTPELHETVLAEARTPLQKLAAAGLTVVMPTPTPVFPSPVFRCVDWFNSINPDCQGGFSISRAEMEQLASPARERVEILTNEGLVATWNLFDTLCPGEHCVTERDGRHMFYDGDHLSRWGNYVLMPGFIEILSDAWNLEPRH